MNKLHLDYTDVERMVQTIIRDINLDGFKPDYIVGITRGGLLPAVLISQYMNVPMYSLDVSLRDTTELGPESNCWMAEDASDGKNILIVDDINDTGATIKWIKKDWNTSVFDNNAVWGGDGNVKTAVVVHNESSEWQRIDYSGLDINKAEDDVWVVFPFEDWWMSKPK